MSDRATCRCRAMPTAGCAYALVCARITPLLTPDFLQLLIDGTAVVLDSNGMATFKPTTAGTITTKAIATDTAGNPGEATFSVVVIDTQRCKCTGCQPELGCDR